MTFLPPIAGRRAAAVAAFTMVGALAAACDRSTDVVIGEDFRTVLDPLPRPTTALDVLFVVDTSQSMAAEQAALVAAAGERLFAQLTADLGAPPDLQVAVVSTDVGVGQPAIPGCPAIGWDGRFRVGAAGVTCPIQGSYLVDRSDGAGGRSTNYQGTLVDAFSCMATLGTTGCGFEQPLEAMRRGLDGRYAEHGGFLRPDALLLIVFVTDEDDCSAFDTAVYGDPGAGPTSPFGVLSSFRCFEFGVECDPDDARVHGVKRACVPRAASRYITAPGEYADFVRALKPDPSMVMLAGMFGPLGPVVVGPDPDRPEAPALEPTCSSPETGVAATPPIRLAALAGEFPSRFVFESLCSAAMSERLYRVTRSTSGVMSQRPCLFGDLGADVTTDRCRAYDVIGSSRTGVDRCTGAAAANACFEIAPSAQCDYTPSGLAAGYRGGTLAAGHRLVVECLARVE